MSWHGKDWASTHQVDARCGCRDAGKRNWNKAAWLPFKEQQLNREHDGSKRRGKRRGHAGRSSGYKKRLSFSRCKVKKLGDQRTESPARHDDGAFRAEGTSRADGNSCGNGLKDGQSRLNLGSAQKNGLNRLRDAVAANLVRAKPGHQPHNQPANHRYKNYPEAQVGISR